MRRYKSYSSFLTIGLGLNLAAALPGLSQEKVTYQDQILALVENNCAKCHNPDKRKGDLDLTSYNSVLKGGGSGPVVASGNPDGSKLMKAITHAEEPTMPPNKKLADKEIDVFKKWIAGGLLETTGSKAVTISKPVADFSLKSVAIGKPDGPLPMPKDLPMDPVVHTAALNPVVSLACHPWSPLVAIAAQKQVLLYHSDTLELLGVFAYTEGQPWDVKFSRNGKLLLAGGGHGGKSGRVVVWDMTTGKKLMTLGDEYDIAMAADISPDQGRIALGGPGRLVKIHSTKTGELLHKIKKHTDWVTAVTFSPNGEWLATGDRNGGISLWDADNGHELFALAGHKAGITALSWRDDSRIVASSSEDGTVKLWETQDGKQIKTWNAHNGGVLSVGYTHDARLISCGRDNAVVCWDASGNKSRTFEFRDELPLRAAFSHDGARVFASDFGGRVTAWNTADGKRLGELDANPPSLAERIAALEKTVTELLNAENRIPAALTAAEAEITRATRELELAAAALNKAQAEQTAKENEVARLKQSTEADSAPNELQAKLVEARKARFQARQASTNAVATVQEKTKEAEVAKAKLERVKKETGPGEKLRTAKAALARLQAAQSTR